MNYRVNIIIKYVTFILIINNKIRSEIVLKFIFHINPN